MIRDLLIRSKDTPSCLQEASSAYKLWMASFNNDSEGNLFGVAECVATPDRSRTLFTKTA